MTSFIYCRYGSPDERLAVLPVIDTVVYGDRPCQGKRGAYSRGSRYSRKVSGPGAHRPGGRRESVSPRDRIVAWSRAAADILALGLAGFAIYLAGFGVFDEVWVRAGTTGLPILVSLLHFSTQNMDVRRDEVTWGSIALNAGMLGGFGLIYYLWITLMTEQLDFFVDFTVFDYLVGFAGIALIFYLTFRHFGVPLFLVCLLSLVILLFGNLVPGTLNIPEVEWFLISEKLWYSTDGVFGRPVAVVGQVVLVFILFGAILETSGAGATLLKFAFAVTGRLRGGPAHAAIIGSASFGTMNGAAVANVVTTGVFTIPMIKRTGFPAKFAGAVEAAASTGGQIMPPVMGAVAFLMADLTGIPYLTIIAAAAIPALMYYLSLFSVVWLEARKQGLRPTPKAERARLDARDWIRSISFFVPLGVIVSVLMTGRTAQNAGFYGLIAAFVLSLVLYPEFRSLRKIRHALIRGGAHLRDHHDRRRRDRLRRRDGQHVGSRHQVRRDHSFHRRGQPVPVAGGDGDRLPAARHGGAGGRGLSDHRPGHRTRAGQARAFAAAHPFVRHLLRGAVGDHPAGGDRRLRGGAHRRVETDRDRCGRGEAGYRGLPDPVHLRLSFQHRADGARVHLFRAGLGNRRLHRLDGCAGDGAWRLLPRAYRAGATPRAGRRRGCGPGSRSPDRGGERGRGGGGVAGRKLDVRSIRRAADGEPTRGKPEMLKLCGVLAVAGLLAAAVAVPAEAQNRVTGLSPKNGDFKNINLNFASALQAFQDRQIDVYTIGCLDPCAQLRQVAATSKIRFLGLPNAADLDMTPALKKFFTPLGRAKGVISKGAYGGNHTNEADVWSNDAILGVTVRAGLDNDTVYKMTKLFWSNLEGIRSSAPYMDAVSLAFATQKANMEFHPGAAKYYKEAGVWKE